MSDPSYQEKKARFARMLTVYGRNAVLETLQDPSLTCHALHLAQTNRPSKVIQAITDAATVAGIEVKTHTREALARISKNGKQDQGVALDVMCPAFGTVEQFIASPPAPGEPHETGTRRLLALDGISNPQKQGFSEIPYRSDNLFRFLIV